MGVVTKLRREMKSKGVSVYKVAKITGIKYELLRRTFCGMRKLSADELILILDKCNIDFEKVKE